MDLLTFNKKAPSRHERVLLFYYEISNETLNNIFNFLMKQHEHGNHHLGLNEPHINSFSHHECLE